MAVAKTIKNNVEMSWEKVRFIDLIDDITGGNYKIQNNEYLNEGDFPIIDQGDKFIGGYTNNNCVVNRIKDVVIFGDHTKAIKFVDFDFCLGADGVKVLQPKDELDSKFFYFYLKTITLPDVGYSRHFKFLKELLIPLPPLPTQKRIADILDTADALRRKDQELLTKYDQLAQAIFIDMFGDPVKNEKGWEVNEFENYIDYIGDIGSNGSNAAISKNLEMSDVEDYAIMIRTTNLNANNFTNNLKYISKKTYDYFSKSKIYGGEIIMNKIGSAGDFWIMPQLNKPVSLGLNQLVQDSFYDVDVSNVKIFSFSPIHMNSYDHE
jgi:type I restriction enzyme S subunit